MEISTVNKEAHQQTLQASITAARNRARDAIMRGIETQDFIFDATKLEKATVELLIKERRAVILKLLGLTDRWGKIEIDTDARNDGFSYGMMADHVRAAMEKWFNTKFAAELERRNRSLDSDAFMQRAMGAYDRLFEDELTRLVREHAREQARLVARRLMADTEAALSVSMKD